ncbi:thiol reductase thioredoxin [bacterium SCN 62-11]|nr:thioredoxin family protein [Candidatus Eremiobacteraeota bacterium]ODT75093.1 MAG: thiol reductase thioredoxin [bacterium SCN 62-11]
MAYLPQYTTDEPSRSEVDAFQGATLLEFGAEWCPHCQAVQPALRQLLADHPEVRHVKVEDGKGRPLGRSYAVKLWPNLVLIRDGQILDQLARPDQARLEKAFQAFKSAE